MPSSGTFCHVGLVRTDYRRNVLPTTSAFSSSQILSTLKMGAKCSSETFVLTRLMDCYISEYDILHYHRCVNPKPDLLLVSNTVKWQICDSWLEIANGETCTKAMTRIYCIEDTGKRNCSLRVQIRIGCGLNQDSPSWLRNGTEWTRCSNSVSFI
jgi:hypothetical protein